MTAVVSGGTVAKAKRAVATARALQEPLNAFTSIREEGVLRDAERLQAALGRGEQPGALSGRTMAVKDLFDVEGIVTLAGSRILAAGPPAKRDATVVSRIREAGALLLGSTTMDEFAFGFTTENTHYGRTRNPWDPQRLSGGSSGGSAAAVASGIVAAALGTDTNGSVRIPSAFCGVFGMRPTPGTVPRTGSVLFAPSFDVVGPIARTTADLAAVFDVIAGPDGQDHTCATVAREPIAGFLRRGAVRGLRVARAAGEIWGGALPEVLDAARRVADALGATTRVDLPDVPRARAAATTITAAEGADQHQDLLRQDPEALDPAVRARFLAGMDVPAVNYLAAQRFLAGWRDQVLDLLGDVDVLVLPTAPFAAPRAAQRSVRIAGTTVPIRAILGRFTQPLSCIGLPALSVPVPGHRGVWVGVQLAARPGADGLLIAVAAQLEADRVAVTAAPAPQVSRHAQAVVAWD